MLRHEYRVTPSTHRPSGRSLPAGWTMRSPARDDLDALAELMLDAYRGTIDYEGETLAEAAEEVEGYFAGDAMLAASVLAIDDREVQSALLISWTRGVPLVGYVMTRAAAKNRGVASALLDEAVARTWESGESEVRAWITAGNEPSEAIFLRAGFEVIDSIGDD